MAGPGCLASDSVVVVGAGLTGGLIALALARLGLTVIQVAPPSQEPGSTATGLSYGSLSLGTTGRAWRNFERLHTPLGWTACGLKLHDRGWLGRRLTLPASRVDGPTLMAALPRALAAAGVQQLPALVQGLEAGAAGGWRLRLLDLPSTNQRQRPQGEPQGELQGVPPLGASILEARQVVLAAGAGSLDIWPPLARQLGISWAGVLALETNPGSNPWLRQVAKGRLVLNQQEQRLGLEDQAGWLAEERWIVDASAAPWGPKGVLVGQISLVRPLDGTRQAPDPARMEQRLRQGLQGWDPQLAALVGPYRQIPVAFGLQGRALVGPVPGALGLWTFTGFRSPFSTAPQQADQLAQSLAANLTNRDQPKMN
jgi:glycine/D-amino acid oxidase-like deaminating enzyme